MRMLVLALTAVTLSGCATTTWSDDAVTRFLKRAEMCERWMGEEPYDAERRAEIDRNLRDLRCTSITRDGQALRISRREGPEDLRRIDEALAGF